MMNITSNQKKIIIVIGVVLVLIFIIRMFSRSNQMGGMDEHNRNQNIIMGEKLRKKTKDILLSSGCKIEGNKITSPEGWPSFYEPDKKRKEFSIEWAMGCIVDSITIIDDEQENYYQEQSHMKQHPNQSPAMSKTKAAKKNNVMFNDLDNDDYSEHIKNRSASLSQSPNNNNIPSVQQQQQKNVSFSSNVSTTPQQQQKQIKSNKPPPQQQPSLKPRPQMLF